LGFLEFDPISRWALDVEAGSGGVGVKGLLLKEETICKDRSREDTMLGTKS
jgi:hypothetical protein